VRMIGGSGYDRFEQPQSPIPVSQTTHWPIQSLGMEWYRAARLAQFIDGDGR
jgi:hypothetical protein